MGVTDAVPALEEEDEERAEELLDARDEDVEFVTGATALTGRGALTRMGDVVVGVVVGLLSRGTIVLAPASGVARGVALGV